MPVRHASPAPVVTTTATDLTSGVPDKFGHADGGPEVVRSVLLTNEGSTPVLIGDDDVTVTDYGYALAAGASMGFDLGAGDVLFGIVASGTAVVRALHVGV